MKSAKLSKSPLLIILIIALLAGVAYFGTDYFALSGTPVYVDFDNLKENPGGYSGKYYVGDVVLAGNTATYKIIPKSGPSDAMIFQIGWTESKIKVLLEEDNNPLKYWQVAGYTFCVPYSANYLDVPYYNLNMNNRKIVTKATVKVDPVGGDVITKYLSNEIDVSSSTYTSQTFKVMDKKNIERTIYIRYNGLNFYSGQLPPATPMSVVKQGSATTYQLVKFNDLESAIEDDDGWNEDVYKWCFWNCGLGTLCEIADKATSWNGVYNWMVAYGRIKDECKSISGVNRCDITLGTDSRIDFQYDKNVFVPTVTFYVPEELGYMVIVEQMPEFIFNSIPTINGVEGGTATIKATGTAKGTGSIDLSVSSGAVSFVSWDGGSVKEIVKDKSYTFTGTLHFNTGLTADRYFDAMVYSDAGGYGPDTSKAFQIYLTDKDTAKNYDLRVYAVYEGTTDKVLTAPLYAGRDIFIGYGDNTRQDIPTGSYDVYSENVTGWYAEFTKEHPKTVNVNSDTTVKITFTKEPPGDTSLPWWMYALYGIFGIGILGFVALIMKELGIKIEATHILILIAIIIFAALAWYFIQALEGLSDAIGAWKPW